MNQSIVGHELQRQQLAKLLAEKRLPHACLFAGLPGIGKRLVALELAQTLFCQTVIDAIAKGDQLSVHDLYGGCNQCSKCALFEASNLPDLLQVDCSDKQQVKVDQIRSLLYTLNLKAFSGGVRVVIFDNAELLSVQSANVLLKSLEEPRADTHFILITSNSSALPITVRSRCQTWHFQELSYEQVRAIVEKTPELSSQQEEFGSIDTVALLADGSLENIALVSQNVELWEQLGTAISRVLEGDACLALELAEKAAKDKKSLPEFVKLLRIYARSQLHAESNQGRKALWATILTDSISAEYYLFSRHISAQYILSNLLLKLAPNKLDSAAALFPFANPLLDQTIVR